MIKDLNDRSEIVPADRAELIARAHGYPIAGVVRLVSDGRTPEQWQIDRYGRVVFPITGQR